MKGTTPTFKPDAEGKFPCPYKKCEDREPFRNINAINMHYNRSHAKTIVPPANTRTKQVVSGGNGKTTFRGNQCKVCKEKVPFGQMLQHWKQAHSDLELPNHLKYADRHYRERKSQLKASLKPSSDTPSPQVRVESRIFSYFCPGCGSPIAVALHKDECAVCHLPQGPIFMGLNLAVSHMV